MEMGALTLLWVHIDRLGEILASYIHNIITIFF